MSDCWFWQISCNVQEAANKAKEQLEGAGASVTVK